MTTHYNSSRGPVEISAMPYPHLVAARAKLIRDREDDSRDAEISAMTNRVEEMEAEFAESEQADGG